MGSQAGVQTQIVPVPTGVAAQCVCAELGGFNMDAMEDRLVMHVLH